VLTHAAQNTNGKITWFPDNVKGGARQTHIPHIADTLNSNFRSYW
jgi:hypothetical protein